MARMRRIKPSDNASTIPGRVTFPTGSNVEDPDWKKQIKKAGLLALNTIAAPATALQNAFTQNPNDPAWKNRLKSQVSEFANYGRDWRNTYLWNVTMALTAASRQEPAAQPQPDITASGSFDFPAGNAAPGFNPSPPAQPQPSAWQPGKPPVSLQTGQYVDAAGQIKIGTTPFGTNAAGQRLDAQGQVWNPATATRDIYGRRFAQVGEVRWERNNRGKLEKVQYMAGGKKKIVGPKGRKS